MKKYSSTVLGYMSKHCAKSLDYHESGQERDREFFQPGIAAHAVLQEIALKQPHDLSELESVADATVKELLTNGRSYNGVHEPPMSPDHALEGRELAIQWMINNGMPEGDLQIENGLGIDKAGNPVAYDDDKARYRAIFDLMYPDIEGDEESSYPVMVVRDYKSAWPTNADELETLQRKGQAVIARAHKKPDDEWIGIRLEVCNLRTGMTFAKTIMLDEVGESLLQQWQRDILMLCDVADGKREARPGANCMACPWVLPCPDALEVVGENSKAEIAVQFAVAQARRDELFKIVKGAITEGAAKVPGGLVGYKKQSFKKMREEGHRQIAYYWQAAQGKADEVDPSLVSAIKAIGCGSTQVENMSKILFPERGSKKDRLDFIDEIMEVTHSPRFGVWK